MVFPGHFSDICQDLRKDKVGNLITSPFNLMLIPANYSNYSSTNSEEE